MRFPKTLSFLMVATVLPFAQSAWVRQRNVAPTETCPDNVGRSAPAGHLPGTRNVAASLPRHGGVALTLRSATDVGPNSVRPGPALLGRACADLKAGATTAGSSPGIAGIPAKPFTQEQVTSMVRDGFGDDSGAKLIEQRGIDFATAEDFLQALKAAGASEAFLEALLEAKPSVSTSAKKPLNQVQVITLLAGQVPNHRVATLVQERGIDFDPTDDYLQEVRLASGEDELIGALKSAKVTKPATVAPAEQARQAQVPQHVVWGGELYQKGQYAEAEQEYRVALLPVLFPGTKRACLPVMCPVPDPRSLSEIDFDSHQGKAADSSAAGGCYY